MIVAAAILAAGGSRRLGQPKQLLRIDGVTLAELVVARVCSTSCDRFALVVGAHATDVVARVQRYAVDIIYNADWEAGLGSSVRAAARWARRTCARGLLLCVVDQPKLSTTHLDELVQTFRQTGNTVGSRYSGALGVPAIFGAAYFDDLEVIAGDRGARSLLGRRGTHVIDWPDGAVDIDLPGDLAQLT
jgi:CTP:molybdopterin cytidylyltransferase MocA